MELDINEFNARLNKEIARGNRDVLGYIIKEIREAEDMKAHLMDDMKDDTKDFLNTAAARLDTYVFQLQEKEKELRPTVLPLDQKIALEDETMRKEFKKNMDKLEDMGADDQDAQISET